jgi:hypothetical protein
MAKAVSDIEYTNFKSQVKNKLRGNAYMRIWAIMNDLQALFGHGGIYNDARWAPDSSYLLEDDDLK